MIVILYDFQKDEEVLPGEMDREKMHQLNDDLRKEGSWRRWIHQGIMTAGFKSDMVTAIQIQEDNAKKEKANINR